MGRPRCPFCKRPVGREQLRCPVCRTRLWPWYAVALALALGALALIAILLFREAPGRPPF